MLPSYHSHHKDIYHKNNFSQTTQLPDDGWKKQPKHVGELCMTFKNVFNQVRCYNVIITVCMCW